MALINCSECSAQISDKATACPQCGNPLSSGDSVSPASSGSSNDSESHFSAKSRLPFWVTILGLVAGLVWFTYGNRYQIYTDAKSRFCWGAIDALFGQRMAYQFQKISSRKALGADYELDSPYWNERDRLFDSVWIQIKAKTLLGGKRDHSVKCFFNPEQAGYRTQAATVLVDFEELDEEQVKTLNVLID